MFTIINIIIIIIIICKFHARVCPWVQDDAKLFCLVPSSNQSGRRYSVVQDHSPGSWFWVYVVLRHPFSLFHSSPDFLFATSKALIRSSSGEARVVWPHKCHRFKLKLLMSPEKKLAWNQTCWCKLQSLLKFSTFFSNILQSFNWEICIFNNSRNNLDFFFHFYCSNLVFIYSIDSNSNFRLLHLILDYIIDNL